VKTHEAVLLSLALSLSVAQPGTTAAAQSGDVTVRGCVEQDAAARSPLYKLVTPGLIYRLEAGASIDLRATLGHTVDATGTVEKRDSGRPGREDTVLTVKAVKSIADHCD
jgi:hypothetical protein